MLSDDVKSVLAGALPAPLQGYTVYEAAVLSKGSADQAVTAFVKYLASDPDPSVDRARCRNHEAGGYKLLP
jgi:ABC-type molybdate transport system substrate-binding protein